MSISPWFDTCEEGACCVYEREGYLCLFRSFEGAESKTGSNCGKVHATKVLLNYLHFTIYNTQFNKYTQFTLAYINKPNYPSFLFLFFSNNYHFVLPPLFFKEFYFPIFLRKFFFRNVIPFCFILCSLNPFCSSVNIIPLHPSLSLSLPYLYSENMYLF